MKFPFKKTLILTAASLMLAGCATESSPSPTARVDTVALQTILDNQPDDTKARFQFRNPNQTLEFFGIAPGMTVAEALPGSGWYSKILIPYLGSEGELIGVDYAMEMWSEFSFATPEFIESKASWPEEWTAEASEWVEGGAPVSATTFSGEGSPSGEVDAILFIRALHNFNRFEAEGKYMTKAVALAHDMLKPNGIVGVVQHRAPESASDEWANGSKGYLKQSRVIALFEAAGFEFVASSEINANPKDTPGEDDIVWRLPPSLSGARDNEVLKAERMAIGESDRMTLKFRKL